MIQYISIYILIGIIISPFLINLHLERAIRISNKEYLFQNNLCYFLVYLIGAIIIAFVWPIPIISILTRNLIK